MGIDGRRAIALVPWPWRLPIQLAGGSSEHRPVAVVDPVMLDIIVEDGEAPIALRAGGVRHSPCPPIGHPRRKEVIHDVGSGSEFDVAHISFLLPKFHFENGKVSCRE